MARLHEHQGKQILLDFRIPTPKGQLAKSPDEVFKVAEALNTPVVVKAQVWSTKRAAFGGIQFAASAAEAKSKSEKLFGRRVEDFVIDKVLVEEQIRIRQEFYAGIVIDDSARRPVMIFSSMGGSGIEEIAAEHPDKVARMEIDIATGLRDYQARNLVRQTGIHGKRQMQLAGVLVKLWQAARKVEARSAEINPLVLTEDNEVMAADCRIAVDDYAVFRHPELDIEIARELNRPPSVLDKIAYDVEKDDYRGTFYFIQMEEEFQKGGGYIGFHGAGGGGSMMSMDAVHAKGFKLANFTDTSGNPAASKVYRAAKIILSQKNIDGYFGSGSGVASQEQFHSARGLAKAFVEENLSIPAVIRLGGNSEDRAIDILTTCTKHLPAPVEGYKKDDSADFCAERLRHLVDQHKLAPDPDEAFVRPTCEQPYSFATLTGTITFDHGTCKECDHKVCVESCIPEILKVEDGVPLLAIPAEEAKAGKCIECLACEMECLYHGKRGAYIDLPIPGLNEYRAQVA
ncbi:MAG: ATP-grasp domain-containing protein [bacterium]